VIAVAMHTEGRFYRCYDGPEDLHAEYVRTYPRLVIGVIREALARAGRTERDVTLIAPHNVNLLSWRKIAEAAGYPPDRVYLNNVPDTGHCYGADPFLNLVAARRAGRIAPGDVVVLVTAGLGATFAAAVLIVGEGMSS
jgi:3-oxoacyl-[acyl-carrier-protein] synthase III